jgi:hypothetical protein
MQGGQLLRSVVAWRWSARLAGGWRTLSCLHACVRQCPVATGEASGLLGRWPLSLGRLRSNAPRAFGLPHCCFGLLLGATLRQSPGFTLLPSAVHALVCNTRADSGLHQGHAPRVALQPAVWHLSGPHQGRPRAGRWRGPQVCVCLSVVLSWAREPSSAACASATAQWTQVRTRP